MENPIKMDDLEIPPFIGNTIFEAAMKFGHLKKGSHHLRSLGDLSTHHGE